ncbi:sensor histidine kinase [Marinomonas mediterranea]|jgi:Osmosensitive K+ channel histidine kinase|uniref:Histidine kinase n=1 Tax=Marinomonas mediterranea (strain ATCC 700492 / JCM 21426 / NBRC 103028 / MMB-1) TaxID=717774 RepID=F2K3D3_MARM1|nr:ATP-binding protein [Marinomonas mediterranea]ADZ91275.1 histidine kinase [Marinomonas mediterranea MMB-1]WCN09246.1 hypothetical protein GV055_10070 [Marinomonas mediterranea]WCN13328.1 hypothetical protein GV054_10075 [Marinomonas mediterranea]WCN17396.1 hypothetical protein GV053_10205 [Marinomonas mediterranea MMB-1]
MKGKTLTQESSLSYPAFREVLPASVNDMKNSLSLVLQTLDLIQEDATNGIDLNALAMVQYEATRMQNTLTELQNFYLFERDLLTIQMNESYVVDIVEEQVAANATLWKTKNIQVDVAGDEDLCAYIDASLVSSVINIGLVNASRYTRDRVNVQVEQVEGSVLIAIDDNGDGYPDFILEKFSNLLAGDQASETSAQALAWYYCNAIMEIHKNHDLKGRIDLSNSSSLEGGRFEIYLP